MGTVILVIEIWFEQGGSTEEVGLQLLDALHRLEALELQFQARSRIGSLQNNGSGMETRT
jgi:hypothetical protein